MNAKAFCLTITAGIFGAICAVQAQEAMTSPPDDYTANTLYHPNEFSIDGFASGSLDEYNLTHGALTKKHYRLGAGAGINYFFTQHIGIGGDAYAISTSHHSFVDSSSGNLLLRLPLGESGISPYVFGGAGYQFQGINQIIEQGGGGIEFRLVEHFSLFVDARYVFAEKTDDYALGRAGVRFSF